MQLSLILPHYKPLTENKIKKQTNNSRYILLKRLIYSYIKNLIFYKNTHITFFLGLGITTLKQSIRRRPGR